MTPDIRDDDEIVVDGVTYPIRVLRPLPYPAPHNATFRRRATKRLYVSRIGTSNDTRTVMDQWYPCLPLTFIDAETQQSLGFETPVQLMQTKIAGDDQYISLIVEKVRVRL